VTRAEGCPGPAICDAPDVEQAEAQQGLWALATGTFGHDSWADGGATIKP